MRLLLEGTLGLDGQFGCHDCVLEMAQIPWSSRELVSLFGVEAQGQLSQNRKCRV